MNSYEIKEKTIEYYKEHAKEYIDATIGIDMTREYNMFENALGDGKIILDVGCGSGRDSFYFMNQGYTVIAIDENKEFVDHAREWNIDAFHSDLEHVEFKNMFDGIWACAVLLHENHETLGPAFKTCYEALKDYGVMYCSFKYGKEEVERNGRYYIDLTEETIQDYIGDFKIIDMNITDDHMKRDNKWLNVVLKKTASL